MRPNTALALNAFGITSSSLAWVSRKSLPGLSVLVRAMFFGLSFHGSDLICIGLHLRFGTDDLRAKLIDLLPSLGTVVGLTPCLERTSTQMAAVAAPPLHLKAKTNRREGP